MTVIPAEPRMAGLSSRSQDSGAGEGYLGGQGSPSSIWPDFLVGQTDRPVRVLLVDDDAHIRLVIAQELMADPRTLVVAQASSVREGRKAIKQHEFDVLLVDLHLGDGEGFELLDYLKTVRPSAEAVVISVMENDDEVLRAFELGATGYLSKNSWFGNYPQAVLQVVNGGASITPNLARRLLQRFDKTHADLPKRQEPAEADRLSDREKEVLRMVAGGYTTAEIASRMEISNITVNTHIRNIYRKLQVRTRAQAVRFASLRGLF
ncbi:MULTISPECIES: LuxR C-terminal-related transcriptional regulator [unclassified Acidovorax]|uniref:LuxR C-terminal-related transcriptional regulator n=2 Tax=Acidovorax TaxID=12916 RepID=UPI000B3FC437|nr:MULTISPECIES: response regulator transcription factor [unclassified Acidovorax]MBP3982090.1 response regulator transcription factor [Acidovorax sp. JG5]MBU4422454.1 response regulator transcription factor [Gammaproteobacteria bacterium]